MIWMEFAVNDASVIYVFQSCGASVVLKNAFLLSDKTLLISLQCILLRRQIKYLAQRDFTSHWFLLIKSQFGKEKILHALLSVNSINMYNES